MSQMSPFDGPSPSRGVSAYSPPYDRKGDFLSPLQVPQIEEKLKGIQK